MAWELPLLASRLHFSEVSLMVPVTTVLPECPCVLSCLRVLLEEGKATVPCLAERLTNELILHINKIKVFNEDIDKLMKGEEVVKEKEIRLYNKIREEFENWVVVLTANIPKVKNIIHKEVSIYEKQYRGQELLGFVSYKTFKTIVHQYLEQLVDPALAVLQKVVEIVQQTFADTAKKHFSEFSNLNQTARNKIEDIKMRQAEAADNLIRLQFRMEQLVYCQDGIYSSILKQVQKEVLNPAGKPMQDVELKLSYSKDLSLASLVTEIQMHLNAYFWETSKRLANQIPFIIQYFTLQENGNHLQKAMMQILQEREHYSWLLQEQSDTTTKRRFLKEKIYRLAQARRSLYNFCN